MEGTIGEVRLFAANFQPRNWAYCDGRILAISTNSALFSILGTMYGGNGQTTFALPDFRGRINVSPGQSPGTSNYFEGEMTGYNSVTLLVSNLPSHTHTGISNAPFMLGSTMTGEGTDPADASPATTTVNVYSNQANPVSRSLPATQNLVVNSSGASSPLNIQQPYIGMNYIICMYGIYPSRN